MREWIGLRNLGKYIWEGTAHNKPIVQNTMSPYSNTQTDSDIYSSMNVNYKWFRQDELVRRCTTINSLFATYSAGFEVRIEPVAKNSEDLVDEYYWVKERIDQINKDVNMDRVLFQAQTKRSIFGFSGFEVLCDSAEKLPKRLLPLRSEYLRPEIDRMWRLMSFSYAGKPAVYMPDELMYFQNMPLEGDGLGLSDIEPIRAVAEARSILLKENFPEIVKRLWSPFTILAADTSMLSLDEANAAVDQLTKVARAGKSTAINESIEAHVINMTPDLAGLVKLLDKFDASIIGNYGTPRFLLSWAIENRATAFAELEAYAQGQISHIQRDLKRIVEPYYDAWARQILLNAGQRFPRGQLPFHVKHQWNTVRVIDFYEMAKSVAALYAKGEGAMGRHPKYLWELLNLPADDMMKELTIDKAINVDPSELPEKDKILQENM